jgi:hypothetical protein
MCYCCNGWDRVILLILPPRHSYLFNPVILATTMARSSLVYTHITILASLLFMLLRRFSSNTLFTYAYLATTHDPLPYRKEDMGHVRCSILDLPLPVPLDAPSPHCRWLDASVSSFAESGVS